MAVRPVTPERGFIAGHLLQVAGRLPGLSEGDAVRADGPALRVGGTLLALGGAEVAELRLRRRPAAPAFLVPRLPAVPPAAQADAFEPELAAALRAFSTGAAAESLAALLGLGGGLTPSGDDALVGALAALDWGRDRFAEAAELRRRLAAALPEPLAAHTGTLSAQLLRAAVDGLYAEPLLDLLAAMAGPAADAPAVGRTAAALLAVGHRSGADTLRGVSAALSRLVPAAGFPSAPPAG